MLFRHIYPIHNNRNVSMTFRENQTALLFCDT